MQAQTLAPGQPWPPHSCGSKEQGGEKGRVRPACLLLECGAQGPLKRVYRSCLGRWISGGLPRERGITQEEASKSGGRTPCKGGPMGRTHPEKDSLQNRGTCVKREDLPQGSICVGRTHPEEDSF